MRVSAQRPKNSRPITATPESGPTVITITSAVLTFESFDIASLTLTLSGSPGDNAGFNPVAAAWTINAGGRTWGVIDDESSSTILGATLTLKISTAVMGTNYSSANDLFSYDGSDSTHIPNVSAVTNLPVTFTGGALAVPSGTATYNGVDTLVQNFSIDVTSDPEELTAVSSTGVWTLLQLDFGSVPAAFSRTGSGQFTITSVLLSAIPATGIARWSYMGTSTPFVDSLGRPIPPFADYPLAAA